MTPEIVKAAEQALYAKRGKFFVGTCATMSGDLLGTFIFTPSMIVRIEKRSVRKILDCANERGHEISFVQSYLLPKAIRCKIEHAVCMAFGVIDQDVSVEVEAIVYPTSERNNE